MNLTDSIQSILLSNLIPPNECRIGVEEECFVYDSAHGRLPVNPDDQYSAADLLREMRVLQEPDNPKANYSLEPGGQLEWASSPFRTLHEIHAQAIAHRQRLIKICTKRNLRILTMGVEPIYQPQEIELIRHEKYHLMHEHFSATGKHGHWMMRNTASVQVNLDFSSPVEAEEMAYLADCLEPFGSLLFANSPFMKGKPVGKVNLRRRIWNDTDPARCGNLLDHGMSSSSGLIEKYSRYIQTVPAIFGLSPEGKAVAFEGTLGEWLSSLHQTGKMRKENIVAALHQIFTHVRFKEVLEIRCSDRPPSSYQMAPVAFWVGLLMAENTRQEALALVNQWSIEDRKRLIRTAENLELSHPGPMNRTIREWLQDICALVLKGLDERSTTLNIKNERHFLEPFLANVFSEDIITLQLQRQFAESGLSISNFLPYEEDHGQTIDWN